MATASTQGRPIIHIVADSEFSDWDKKRSDGWKPAGSAPHFPSLCGGPTVPSPHQAHATDLLNLLGPLHQFVPLGDCPPVATHRKPGVSPRQPPSRINFRSLWRQRQSLPARRCGAHVRYVAAGRGRC